MQVKLSLIGKIGQTHLLQSWQNLYFQNLLKLNTAFLSIKIHHFPHFLSYRFHVVTTKHWNFYSFRSLRCHIQVKQRTCVLLNLRTFSHFSSLMHPIHCFVIIRNVCILGIKNLQDVCFRVDIWFKSQLIFPFLLFYFVRRLVLSIDIGFLTHLKQLLISISLTSKIISRRFITIFQYRVRVSHNLILNLLGLTLVFFSFNSQQSIFALLVQHQQIDMIDLCPSWHFEIHFIFSNQFLTLANNPISISFSQFH